MITIHIIFIILALIMAGKFIYDKEPFIVWIWPINAAIWCFNTLLK